MVGDRFLRSGLLHVDYDLVGALRGRMPSAPTHGDLLRKLHSGTTESRKIQSASKVTKK